jgi:hypothetical protein
MQATMAIRADGNCISHSIGATIRKPPNVVNFKKGQSIAIQERGLVAATLALPLGAV